MLIGAGPTGVELVGQIAELAHTVLSKDYRSVKTNEARIILLEGAGAVLPPFAKKLQDYTQAGVKSGQRPQIPDSGDWSTKARV